MLSAKGAMSGLAWGTAPGIRLDDLQALKARFNRAVPKVNRAFSAGPLELHGTWDVVPGCELNVAPLALSTIA